jgi:hypothetical protein
MEAERARASRYSSLSSRAGGFAGTSFRRDTERSRFASQRSEMRPSNFRVENDLYNEEG